MDAKVVTLPTGGFVEKNTANFGGKANFQNHVLLGGRKPNFQKMEFTTSLSLLHNIRDCNRSRFIGILLRYNFVD